MASVEECQAALARLASALADNAGEVRRRTGPGIDRTIVCRVTDLGTAFHGRLRDGELVDVTQGDDPDARIAMSAGSDDFIAMVDGQLDFARALTSRRVTVRASPLDLWRLRRLW